MSGFALTASRSATLFGISHCEEDDDDDEDGAAQELDMSRLLYYEFLVALVLHRDDAECGEETEAEREESITLPLRHPRLRRRHRV